MATTKNDVKEMLQAEGLEVELTATCEVVSGSVSQYESPATKFRQELKQKLMTEAQTTLHKANTQKPHRTFVQRYAGLAAAILICAVGLTVYMNQPPQSITAYTDQPADAQVLAQPDGQERSSLDNSEQGIMGEKKSMMIVGGYGVAMDSNERSTLDRDSAVALAQEQVDYASKVLSAQMITRDGVDYWSISLGRDGMGIPNRDDFIINTETGELTRTLSAQ